MPLLANAQQQVSAAPGTNAFALGAATPGAQTWSAAGAADGVAYSYRAEEGASWEIGTGTYAASGATLSRTVAASSNGNAAVAFGAAAVVSQVALPADLAPHLVSTSSTSGYSNLTTGEQIMLAVNFTATKQVYSIKCYGRVSNNGGSVDVIWTARVFDTTGGGASQLTAKQAPSTAPIGSYTGVTSLEMDVAGFTPGHTYAVQWNASAAQSPSGTVAASFLSIDAQGYS